MNQDLKEYLQNSLKSEIRMDNRKPLDFREVKVEKGVVETAEGSAKVNFGDTEVIAGVKISVGTPYGDTPEEGVLMVGAELLPMANPHFESGPPGIDAIEMARVIDRGIREGKMMDTKKLCIEAGEAVWMISVDICPINADGNLLDAMALAAVCAVEDAVFPKYDPEKGVDYTQKTKDKLPMVNVPVTVTVFRSGDQIFVDPTEDEEKFCDARLTVAFLEDGKVCAMQKGLEGGFSPEQIDEILKIGFEKSKELRKHI